MMQLNPSLLGTTNNKSSSINVLRIPYLQASSIPVVACIESAVIRQARSAPGGVLKESVPSRARLGTAFSLSCPSAGGNNHGPSLAAGGDAAEIASLGSFGFYDRPGVEDIFLGPKKFASPSHHSVSIHLL